MVLNIFMLRSKPHNIERLPLFLEKNLVAIGWHATGDLTGKTMDQIKEILHNEYEYEGQSLRTNLGTVKTFVNTMEGDLILIREKENNDYVHIGKINGSYEWKSEYLDLFMPHTKSITWLKAVPYDSLNASIQTMLKNPRTTCKYPGSYEESELDQFINVSTKNSENQINSNQQVIDDMLAILQNLANNAENEQVRLDAAKELLNHLRK